MRRLLAAVRAFPLPPEATVSPLTRLGRRACVALALLAATATHAGWLDKLGIGAPSAGAGSGVTLATWNLEWLMVPAEHERLAARCTHQQPRSQDRALPCTPGRTPPPSRTLADLDALARSAQALHGTHQVDAVALQEVDGPEAAKQVFRQGWQLGCFTRRAHPQKVGFAIRDGVPFRCNGDLAALDIDGGTR